MKRIESLSALVGRTPLLVIRYRFDGRPARLFAKWEITNMTGSVKDRMALHILRRARERGELRDNDVICEATSGNTGISFSAIGRALGYSVRIYMPDWMSRERELLLRSLGAEIVSVSREQGGFLGAIALTRAYAAERGHVYLPRQFDNPDNVEAHEITTGPEIEAQLGRLGFRADAFVAGVGTGGTVMGVGRCLRHGGRPVRVHPLEPANSPTLRTGTRAGCHRIQGISDEFVPSIVNLAELDAVMDVWDGDAILMSQAICRGLGLGVGISSGANMIGAIKLAAELGPDAVVATVICDSNKKYLSTALAGMEPARDDYITPRVQLESFTSVG